MFINWLIGELGTPGEYQYQGIHLISTGVVLLVLALVIFLGRSRRITDKGKRIILRAIAIFQLVFEVTWRLIYLFVKKDDILCWWPMYPCNLGGIILPIIALTNWTTGKKMFYLFGFIGACLTFALPEGIFCRDVMVFPILKSVLQHTGLLMIPCFEYAAKFYRHNIKDYPWTILGCFIHLFNCEVIDRWLGFEGDYMFLRSGLPFVIPGIPGFVVTVPFAILVMAILSYLSDIKVSNEFFLKKKTAK